MIPNTIEHSGETIVAVSGQVRASHEERVRDFPTEVELAETVFELPPQVNGQLLAGDTTKLIPVRTIGHVIRLFLVHSRRFLASEGRLTVTQFPNGLAYGGGVHKEHNFHCLGKTRLVLLDHDDTSIAMCTQERNKFHREYSIMGVRPLMPGDAPKSTENGVLFYPWFRLLDINDAVHGEFRIISVWNGNEYIPMWRVYPATRRPGNKAANLCLVKRTEILITQESDQLSVVGILHKTTSLDNTGWDITIAPGVDPALVLCVAAIVEELN